MNITYINRSLEPVLRQAVSEFPAVVLTGPRQSGKTTILKHLFIDRYRYASLEPPDVRAAAFLHRFTSGEPGREQRLILLWRPRVSLYLLRLNFQ